MAVQQLSEPCRMRVLCRGDGVGCPTDRVEIRVWWDDLGTRRAGCHGRTVLTLADIRPILSLSLSLSLALCYICVVRSSYWLSRQLQHDPPGHNRSQCKADASKHLAAQDPDSRFNGVGKIPNKHYDMQSQMFEQQIHM